MKKLLSVNCFVEGEFPVMVESLPYSGVANTEMHTHEFSEFILITQGESLHFCNGKCAKVQPEDILLIHPGSAHCFENGENLEAIALLYDAHVPYAPLATSGFPLMRDFYPDENTPKRDEALPIGKFPQCDFALIQGILLRLRYEVRRKRLGHKLLIFSMFTEAVTYFARGYSMNVEDNVPGQLQKAISYMNHHYMEKVTITQLCRIAGLSERGLFRMFQKSVMLGPYEYLVKLRILHAMELLRNKKLSISEIALQCGFYDSNHLCKIFKQEFGRTPKHFRDLSGELNHN